MTIRVRKLPYPFLIIVFLNVFYVLSLGEKAGPFSWDFPGHGYQAISSLTNLSRSIFNFKYFLGFYPILYPPLFHFLRDVISKTTSLSPYESILVLLAIFQNAFFYVLYKIFNAFKVNHFYYFLLSMTFIVTSIGFINISSWEAGTGVATTGFFLFALFVYLLKTNTKRYSYLSLGLVFGLTVLTHTISASAILGILGISTFISLIKKDKETATRYVITAIVGLAIGAIWLVPYLVINPLVPRGGMTGYQDVVFIFLAGFFSYLVFEKLNIRQKSRDYSLGVSGILLFLLGMFPYKLNSTGIQFNRYAYFGLIIIIPFIFAKTQIKNAPKSPRLIAVLVVLFLLIAKEVERFPIYPKIINENQYSFSGRILDATTTSGKLHFPHYLNTKLVLNGKNLVATGGTFVENAPNAILALSLRMAVNPNSWFPLFTGSYKNILTLNTRENIKEKMRLFGISHILISNNGEIGESALVENENKYHVLDEVVFGNASEHKPIVDYAVELKDTSPLVLPLSYIPEYTKDRNLYDAWSSLSLGNLYTKDQNVVGYVTNDLDFNASVDDLQIDSDEIRFKVFSKAPAPILVKFAYSPFLKAYSNGREIKVMKVSPDFILVFAQGNVAVTTFVPKSFVLAKYVTLFSLLLVSSYLAVRVFRKDAE